MTLSHVQGEAKLGLIDVILGRVDRRMQSRLGAYGSLGAGDVMVLFWVRTEDLCGWDEPDEGSNCDCPHLLTGRSAGPERERLPIRAASQQGLHLVVRAEEGNVERLRPILEQQPESEGPPTLVEPAAQLADSEPAVTMRRNVLPT